MSDHIDNAKKNLTKALALLFDDPKTPQEIAPVILFLRAASKDVELADPDKAASTIADEFQRFR